jgi:hypothetical protein
MENYFLFTEINQKWDGSWILEKQKRTNQSKFKTFNIIIGCLNEVIKNVKVSWLSKVRTELIISYVLNILYTLNCTLKYDLIDFII